MSKHRHIDAICIGITVFTLLLTLLFMNGKALGVQAAAGEENSGAMFTANDQNADWDTVGATRITLSDAGSTVQGNGAYVNRGDVYIVYAGKYLLSGALSDGSVIIDADGDDKVWLMLDGAAIHCEDGAAIRVEQAGKVFVTLREGTENTLSSGAAYSEEAVSAGVDGTVYSRDDLTINGAGLLRVTAEYRHGIVCNDDLVITGGAVSVTAAQDALHANDSVRVKNADLTLTAGDDGITASNDDETAFLYVESGNISIPSCCEGLEAVRITIAGGTLDIAATDDGINANGYGGSSAINITGGDITVTVANGRDADGLDSNKDIFISGGRLFVSVSDSGGSCALDCGSEYGGVCEISGGTVLACGSSGMAEGFDASSPQGFVMRSVSAPAGTAVAVRDAGGNELLRETVPCSFSSVLVSTPEMKLGDTCTLVVGDTETELTIDNSSSAGGFGGFGGGRMRGGAGIGGGQMPGRGGLGRNGESSDGSATDRTQGISAAQNGSVQAVAYTVPVARLLGASDPEVVDGNVPDGIAAPDAQTGDAPQSIPESGDRRLPEMPSETDGGMTPPDLPLTGAEGELPPGLPQGDIPDFSQNEDDRDDMQSALPQGGRDFGGRREGGVMQGPNGGIEVPGNTAQASAGTPIPAETWLLLGVSGIALLAGCVIAACYKRRGR